MWEKFCACKLNYYVFLFIEKQCIKGGSQKFLVQYFRVCLSVEWKTFYHKILVATFMLHWYIILISLYLRPHLLKSTLKIAENQTYFSKWEAEGNEISFETLFVEISRVFSEIIEIVWTPEINGAKKILQWKFLFEST